MKTERNNNMISFGPPRPNAFITSLTTLDDLPGVQTLMYTLQSTSMPSRYPPEYVALASTKEILTEANKILRSYCRVVHLDASTSTSTPSDPLSIYNMPSYERVVHIRNHCLALKDLSYLFHKSFSFEDRRVLGIASDASCSEASLYVLNTRLASEPNAQGDELVDLCIGYNHIGDSHGKLELSGHQILVFLGEQKPWHLKKTDSTITGIQMWDKFYEMSKKSTIALEYVKGIETNEKLQHSRISKRFRELRKFGIDTKIAMEKARSENYGYSIDDGKAAVGKKVGSMFGA